MGKLFPAPILVILSSLFIWLPPFNPYQFIILMLNHYSQLLDTQIRNMAGFLSSVFVIYWWSAYFWQLIQTVCLQCVHNYNKKTLPVMVISVPLTEMETLHKPLHKPICVFYSFIWQAAGSCLSLYLKVDTIISITFYYNVFLTLIHLTKKKINTQQRQMWEKKAFSFKSVSNFFFFPLFSVVVYQLSALKQLQAFSLTHTCVALVML